jgi:hypothetical protein
MTMSKLARALVIGAMLAAMNLASATAVAQAQTSDSPTTNKDAQRPPTEAQVGESWRHRQVAPAGAHDTRRPPTERQVGETWRHPTSTPARPAEPSGQPGWLVLGLGALAAALGLSIGLAVTTTTRARRRVRAGQAA